MPKSNDTLVHKLVIERKVRVRAGKRTRILRSRITFNQKEVNGFGWDKKYDGEAVIDVESVLIFMEVEFPDWNIVSIN